MINNKLNNNYNNNNHNIYNHHINNFNNVNTIFLGERSFSKLS